MTLYMMWLDDTKKKSYTDKLSGGAARYYEKYVKEPNVCLVSPEDLTKMEKELLWSDDNLSGTIYLSFGRLELSAKSYVRPNVFYFGREEGTQ